MKEQKNWWPPPFSSSKSYAPFQLIKKSWPTPYSTTPPLVEIMNSPFTVINMYPVHACFSCSICFHFQNDYWCILSTLLIMAQVCLKKARLLSRLSGGQRSPEYMWRKICRCIYSKTGVWVREIQRWNCFAFKIIIIICGDCNLRLTTRWLLKVPLCDSCSAHIGD